MIQLEYTNKIIYFERKIFLFILTMFCLLSVNFPSKISAFSSTKEEEIEFPYKELCFSGASNLNFEKTLDKLKDVDDNNPAKLYVLAMNLELNPSENANTNTNNVISLLEKSAKEGCGNAKIELWYRYATGQGIAQNNTTATKWAKSALNIDYANTQIGRWFMYISGAEQRKHPDWNRTFSYDDEPDVLYHLGFMYATGLGIKQNYLSAAKWYERAAKKGYAKAQYNLGMLYALGRGVDLDNTKAYALIDLASKNGMEQAEMLKTILAKTLDEGQIKTARYIASSFVKKK
ncbi:MAG: tetratricopeptide repeat protein [Alphaproteobacteria bacterium]